MMSKAKRLNMVVKRPFALLKVTAFSGDDTRVGVTDILFINK